MARVFVTGPADADSAAIIADLASRAGVGGVYAQISHFPDIGSPRPMLGRDIRIVPVLPYVVVYRHTERDDVVSIIRIVHGHRNITRGLLRGASFSRMT